MKELFWACGNKIFQFRQKNLRWSYYFWVKTIPQIQVSMKFFLVKKEIGKIFYLRDENDKKNFFGSRFIKITIVNQKKMFLQTFFLNFFEETMHFLYILIFYHVQQFMSWWDV